MHRDRARRFVLLAAWCALGLACAAPADADLLARCSASAGDRSLCGRVTVPLDRSGALPGTVSLRVRVLPPSSGAPVGTVFAFAGGPGQAAASLVGDFADALGDAAKTRQVVAFDQRGTGGSGRLACPSLAGNGSVVAAVAACVQRLGPARAAYTTAASVADAEAVRAALGVDRITVFGTSYGTKVALAYAAAYPQHVDRIVLDSPVLPDDADPFELATLESVPRVLREECAGAACPFTRDPVRDLAALLHKLAHRPLRGRVLDGHGRVHRTAIDSSDLLDLLVGGDLDPAGRAAFPAAVHAALRGDAPPLLRLAGFDANESLSGGDSEALYVATSCEDGPVPWAPGTPIENRRAATDAALAAIPDARFAPFDRATARVAGNAVLCRAWPEAPIVQPAPPLPALPTLIVSGGADLRTPRANAVALAAKIPGARVLEVPGVGHSVLGSDLFGCATEQVSRFLDGEVPAARCEGEGLFAARPLPPRSLRAVHRVRGLPDRVGRTLKASELTTDDLAQALFGSALSNGGEPSSVGGLRGGYAMYRRGGAVLHRYSYVPGVAVSGTIGSRAKSVTLRIDGAAAARGRVVISHTGWVSGELGGHRFRIRSKGVVAARASIAAASRPRLRLPSRIGR